MRTHWRLAQRASCLFACLLESYLQHKVSPSMQMPRLHVKSRLDTGSAANAACLLAQLKSIAARVLTSMNAELPLN